MPTVKAAIVALALLLATATISLPCVAWSQDDPHPVPPRPPAPVTPFPVPPAPVPDPMPNPPPVPDGTDPYLRHGDWDVVKWPERFFLRVKPPQAVEVMYSHSGDATLAGTFFDGTGKDENRHYTDPHIAYFRVKEYTGALYLDFMLVGTEQESEILSAEVKTGKGPRPPPDPDIDPEPKPPGPTPIPTPTGFRVVFIRGDDTSFEKLSIINSREVSDYLNAKCVKGTDGRPEWRRWPPNVVIADSETKTLRDLWAAAKGTLGTPPQILIAVDGKGELHPLPATKEATLELLKKYGGN